MVFIIGGAIAATGIIIIGPMMAKSDEIKAENIISDELKKQDFIPLNIFSSYGILTRDCIAVNQEKDKIALCTFATTENKVTKTEIFPYQKIMGVEIKHDGVTVSQTKRSSQVAGAVVGGLLLGGLGAVIGGLSGKTTQKNNQNIKKMHLVLYIEDIDDPIKEIEFYRLNSFVTREEATEAIEKWKRIIEIFIKKADEKTIPASHNNNNITSTKDNNIASQLTSLVELKKAGELTQLEYETLKQKLLNEKQKV